MQPTLKAGPKDFFLNLAITICLYINVGSFLALVFGIIDYRFPDALSYYVDPYSSGIRFAIAALIIVYPLFCILTRIEHKDFERAPEKMNLWTHRWAAFLNVFLSGATVAITLIMLINDFLGGELTVRFELKALATIVIAALVFIYYLSDIRKGIAFSKKSRTLYIGFGGLTSLLAIVLGFFVMGSPATVRLYRLDDERVNDLQSIQYQVTTYYQQHSTLPESLATLQNPTNGYILPVDPEGKAFAYEQTANLSFKLCADFSSASRATGPKSPSYAGPYGTPVSDNWDHASGTQCFTRTIDPAQYPPYQK